jgi:DNA polymerase-3 subunit alpha
MSYGSDQLYLKSPEEMAMLFPYAMEGIENTAKIAKRCNVSIEFNNYKLPKFKIEGNKNPFEYLKNLCLEGLGRKYKNITGEIENRLFYELGVIKDMGFIDYFLVVWDFVKYAHDNGIIVGPGRGSAAGSVVAYSLGITNIDPLKYNLLFERFLNPERVSMPDIDIDFCYERRQEVIDYVVGKYGEGHVAQIITFGTLAARAAIRDVGRVMSVPYQTVDTIAKMVPMELGITIEKALEMNPELNKLYVNSGETKKLIDMSLRLEGLPRHSSTHAAGVVICDAPLTEYVPLNQNDGVITTQFTMTTLEELGLLKMDFLGLRTLTVIEGAIKEIRRNHNIDVDFAQLGYSDPNVFSLISQAKTDGVFQLESAGMKSFMKELKPKNLEDIIAGISLYRPGPMDFIPKYIYGKNNPNEISYTHPALENILDETYGCIVYQEQVMQIVRDLAGYSLGRSDLVRRAMSKKKTDVMAEERNNFINGLGVDVPGCVRNGIDKVSAERIFNEMADFAKYAFNKSHAAAYAVIGYQTAWLKYYYPVEFMAALLTSVISGSNTKVSEYIVECKKMGIELLPPDVNQSFDNFSVSGGSIRFGLAAVKNVGRPTIRAVLKERGKGRFLTFTEFINRIDSRDLNKRCLESLIKAGAFDSFGKKRKQLMDVYKKILDGINYTRKNNIEGQLDLFSLTKANVYTDDFPDALEFSKREALNMEKEVLGIYVSGHPLDEYRDTLTKKTNAISIDLSPDSQNRKSDGERVRAGGLISAKSIKYTKNNKAMAFITLEDLYGQMEVILFPNVYEKYNTQLSENTVVLVEGHVNGREDEDYKIICNEVTPVNLNATEKLWLKIPSGSGVTVDMLMETIKYFPGDIKVIIYDEMTTKKYALEQKSWVRIDGLLLHKLKQSLGDKNVVVTEG